MLVDIASILKKSTESLGYAGRFCGDEFIIIMPDINEKRQKI